MVLGVGDAYSVDIAPCTRQDEDGKDGVGGGRLCISCVVGVAVGFCLNWLVRAVAAGFLLFVLSLYLLLYFVDCRFGVLDYDSNTYKNMMASSITIPHSKFRPSPHARTLVPVRLIMSPAPGARDASIRYNWERDDRRLVVPVGVCAIIRLRSLSRLTCYFDMLVSMRRFRQLK